MRSYHNHEDGFYITYRAMGRGASSEAASGHYASDRHPGLVAAKTGFKIHVPVTPRVPFFPHAFWLRRQCRSKSIERRFVATYCQRRDVHLCNAFISSAQI
jgi:hypothetical protein